MTQKQEYISPEELMEFSDSIDTYSENYAQQLLDDDALDIQEVAFLKGYRDWQV